MVKKILISLFLIITIAACACQGTASTSGKVIELKFATIMPPEAAITQSFATWAQRIEDESGGEVKITTYMGGSLLKHGEMLRGVQEGIADIAWYSITEDPGMWDLNSFQNMPFLGFKSTKQAGLIYNELLSDKSLGLLDEFENNGFRPYGVMFPPAFQIFTKNTPVHVPADIKGMKLYALGDMSKVMTSAGAAPVTMEVTDTYTALDRGLIEGMCIHPAAMFVFGLLEFINYETYFGDGGCWCFMNSFIINNETWDSLPRDVKKIFDDLEPWLVEQELAASSSEVDMAMQILADQNATIIELTPAEIQEWTNLAKPLHQDWLDGMASKGKGEQAQKIFDELNKLIADTPM